MDEREALRLLTGALPAAGDDAAVVDGTVVTTDMLHETSDFPDGLSRYSAGWRAVGASLSDVAAMGGAATAAVAVYGAPSFDESALRAFLDGAREACAAVDAAYVGGDLDETAEFTVASTALGETTDPVYRDGASPGEAICVTGRLGRTAGALRLFDAGEVERANELFRFQPRVAAGRAVAKEATAMMDSSDGLTRSLHQLGEAGDHGVAVDSGRIPVHPAVEETARDAADRLTQATTVGEDFELVCTIPADRVAAAREASPVRLTRIGHVTPPDDGIRMDEEPLADEGFTHG